MALTTLIYSFATHAEEVLASPEHPPSQVFEVSRTLDLSGPIIDPEILCALVTNDDKFKPREKNPIDYTEDIIVINCKKKNILSQIPINAKSINLMKTTLLEEKCSKLNVDRSYTLDEVTNPNQPLNLYEDFFTQPKKKITIRCKRNYTTPTAQFHKADKTKDILMKILKEQVLEEQRRRQLQKAIEGGRSLDI